MALATRFTELAGCRVPLQQAPMGPVSTLALAAAVAEAGGVGSISVLGMTATQVDQVLARLAARTTGVLAANFLTAQIDPDVVAAAAARVRIADFFWAEPDPALVETAHRGGALACWQVGSVEEAQAAADAGCDIIAVQGTEAGGHVRGHDPLRPLLDAVLGQVDVPVLAAGGVGDTHAFAAVLAAGAAGRPGRDQVRGQHRVRRPPAVQGGGDGRGRGHDRNHRGLRRLPAVRHRAPRPGAAIVHRCAGRTWTVTPSGRCGPAAS